MSTWVNSDGLEVKFGTTQGADALGGRVPSDGEFEEIVIEISGASVPSADAPISKAITIPSGAWIESADLYVDTTFVGATATLDIGTWLDDGDGTYSALDDNGLIAAQAVAGLTAGAKITGAGAQVGSTVTDSTNGLPLVFSYGYNTAAFTAGAGRLVITYRV